MSPTMRHRNIRRTIRFLLLCTFAFDISDCRLNANTLLRHNEGDPEERLTTGMTHNNATVVKTKNHHMHNILVSYTTESFYDRSYNYSDNDDPPCNDSYDDDLCNYTEEEYVAFLREYIYPKPFHWILIVAHTIVFLGGLFGNFLVCYAVLMNHSMRSVTNYFIVNLAVADFMVILFCLPPTVLWDITQSWFLGEAMCKIVLYFQNVSVTVSVLTLTFISLDRWYAICFPLRFKSTTSRAVRSIGIIWLFAFAIDVPELFVLKTQPGMKLRFGITTYFAQCLPWWDPNTDFAWHLSKAILLYTLPLIFMTFAYVQIIRVLWRSDIIPGHREARKLSSSLRRSPCQPLNAGTHGQLRARRKAAKMLFAVVIMFAGCYLPVHILSILRVSSVVTSNSVISVLSLLSHFMCYANSAINPLIYTCMSGKFRHEFLRFTRCCCCSDCCLSAAYREEQQTAQYDLRVRNTSHLVHLTNTSQRHHHNHSLHHNHNHNHAHNHTRAPLLHHQAGTGSDSRSYTAYQLRQISPGAVLTTTTSFIHDQDNHQDGLRSSLCQ